MSNSAPDSSQRPMRVAIIGAGPAGVYAADILTKADRDFEVSIDLFDQYPAPYGLIRYGVAPDHPRIKGIVNALEKVLDRGDIRFLGNVNYGRDLTLKDFRHFYDAIIFATGALKDAPLDIPGIELEGSFGGADFVSWYDGNPDVPRDWPLDAREIAVIGNGNVALDVARILSKHADDLLTTEIPSNVYEGLKKSPVTDVHVFGRRGPAQVKFTPLELRELSHSRDVDIVLYPEDFDFDEASFGVEPQSAQQIQRLRELLLSGLDLLLPAQMRAGNVAVGGREIQQAQVIQHVHEHVPPRIGRYQDIEPHRVVLRQIAQVAGVGLVQRFFGKHKNRWVHPASLAFVRAGASRNVLIRRLPAREESR